MSDRSIRGAAAITGFAEIKPERRKPGRTAVGLAVELDEGPRMISGIQCAVEDAVCDMPVEAVFEDLDDDWTIVQFKPTS